MAQARPILAAAALAGIAALAVTLSAAHPAVAPAARPDSVSAQSNTPIGQDSARSFAMALAQAKGGTLGNGEVECEDGRLLYTFQVAGGSGVVEISIDALTGEVVQKQDDDAAEGSRAKGSEERHAEGGKKKVDVDDVDDEHEDDEDNDVCGPQQTGAGAAKAPVEKPHRTAGHD